MECHTDTHFSDKSDWHIAGLFIIIGAGAVGVFLPIISQTTRLFSKHQLSVPIYFIQLAQFFGAGVIISTAFIHLFPSAASFLSDPCLGQFSTLYGAWSSLIAMTAILTMHTIEWWLVEAWATRVNHQQPIEYIGEEEEEVTDENNVSHLPMNMPMAAISQVTTTNPVPSVLTSRMGTGSNMVSGSGGFALSKYGNYAAVIQSRQHLALIQNQHRSRCLYSDPQFPLYSSSGLWPTPPPVPSVVPQYYYPKATHCQAKSTPELLRKYTLPMRNSTTAPASKRTSESSTSGSGYAIVSEPLSVQRQRQMLQKTTRNKYPSMPRLPPLINDGAPITAGLMANNKRHSMPRTIGSSSLTDPSVSSEGITSPNQSQKLDTVFEADDCCDNVQASRTTVSEASAHFATAMTSTDNGKFSKRVSITATRASSSPCEITSPAGFASVNTGIPPTQSSCPNHQYYDMPATAASSRVDQAEDSTTVNTQDSVVEANKHNHSLMFPVEIKQRALATYILEFGIALYSVLIGLALGISSNSRDFIALLVAICFQQFFEGMALGTSLAELYWVKAQIMAQHREEQMQMEVDSTVDVEVVESQTFPDEAASPNSISTASSSSADSRRPDTGEFGGYFMVDRRERSGMHSKSRRTLTSMATSFTPEPWLVNPQLEAIADNTDGAAEKSHTEIKVTDPEKEDGRGRYLQPRSNPDRVPGWWKAWISALVFTATCPVGIIIGLALKYIYEPQSRYALLFNGILQSICTGILIYVGLVSLMVGGFNSAPIKDLSRIAQVALFLAVYAGAAVMAGIKIWT